MYMLVKFGGSFYLWKNDWRHPKSVLIYEDVCGKNARSVLRSLRKASNV